MEKVTKGQLTLWQFNQLNGEHGVGHFVSERTSNPADNEFTVSYSSSENKEAVRHNRQLLAEAMGINPAKLFLPNQVHLANIVRVNPETTDSDLLETDALITNEKGICIAVMSADCVPILVYDKKNKAIGAVHSGWKGTVAKILTKTLLKMQSEFGTRGEDLMAAIGPSVCQESYEVGDEVVNAVLEAFGKQTDLMLPQANQKAKLDLWKANKLQLLEFGVRESAVEISNLCTVKNNNHFFSARKGDTGRFAAGIVLCTE